MNTVQIHSILRRLFERVKHKARTVASSGFVWVVWKPDYLRTGGNDGARLILHAIEVRALVMAAANVQLIDVG